MNYVVIDSEDGGSLKMPEFVSFPVRNGRVADAVSVTAETASGESVDVTIDLVMSQPLDEFGGCYLPFAEINRAMNEREKFPSPSVSRQWRRWFGLVGMVASFILHLVNQSATGLIVWGISFYMIITTREHD
ncbi:MAG: hypothetical protein IAE79_17540 [Anaerolinea sp.]|nr:hypothetical protein [Anaerolinea sp.]